MLLPLSLISARVNFQRAGAYPLKIVNDDSAGRVQNVCRSKSPDDVVTIIPFGESFEHCDRLCDIGRS